MLLLYIIAGAAFLAVVCLALAIHATANRREDARRQQVKKRLAALGGAARAVAARDIVRRSSLAKSGLLNRLLGGVGPLRRLRTTLDQAGLKMTVATLCGLCLGVSLALGLVAWILTGQLLAAGSAMAFGLYGPLAWVQRARTSRMEKFQRQFPDALDLICRALQAGHAFTSGMGLAASEFEDPLGPEFAKTLEEINFGLAMDRAMWNMAGRVDCPDLMFFIVSVNIQRETGGNLAEVVGNIARLIRERYKLQGRIQVLSAEGRMSAWVLLGLPFFIALAVSVINPQYMTPLWTEHAGKVVLTVCLSMMGVGVLIIRKLIRIEV